MKIGLVSPYYMDRAGGVQTLLLTMQTELKKRGHTVIIAAPKPRDEERHYVIPEDVVLIGQSAELNVKKIISTNFPLSVSVDSNEIENFLNAYDFDVLNVHEPWMPLMPYQFVMKAECPVVGTIHAKWDDKMVNKAAEKAIAPYVKRVAKKLTTLTAPSMAAGDYAHDYIETEVQIVPNGIDLDYFDPKGIHRLPEYSDGIKNILYVGRLEKRKGVKYLLQAFRELQDTRQEEMRLIIAGAGPLDETLKTYVYRYGLRNVEFLGYISEEHKRRLLKTADLYCSPASFGEAFGIVLLEAMAMKAVTVAGSNPGYASVLKDRGSISLVEPKNTVNMASRMELMLFDRDVRKLWLQWAKDNIEQYDFRKITDMNEEILIEAAKNG